MNSPEQLADVWGTIAEHTSMPLAEFLDEYDADDYVREQCAPFMKEWAQKPTFDFMVHIFTQVDDPPDVENGETLYGNVFAMAGPFFRGE